MTRGFLDRRHRRPDDAHRRGPAARRRALAAARRDQPGGRHLRPGLRLRDRPHRAGRPAPDVRRVARRTSSTTSPSTTSRSLQPAEPEGRGRRGHPAGAATGSGRRASPEGEQRPRAQILASGVAVPWALEAQQLLARRLGRRRRRLERHQLERAAPRRHALRPSRRSCTPSEPAPTPYVTQRLAGAPGPVVAVSDYMRQVPGPDPAVGTAGLRLARHRRLRLLRHPAGGAAVLPRRRSVDRHHRCSQQLAGRGEVDRGAPAQAIEKYRLHDVTAGTTGSAGGDA